MSVSASRREIYVTALSIFAVALALRLVYLVHLRHLPFFDHPIMDASYHDTWARDILGGKTVAEEPFFRAPFYPYLLAFTYLVSKGSYLAPRILQFILGSLTAVITFALARRHAGRTAGLVAGLLAAAYPVLIYFDGELLTETVYIFLTMLGLLLVETAARRQSRPAWLGGGLALGLALITRPNLALFLPVAIAGAAMLSRRRLAAALLLAVGAVIPLAPVTVHNYAVSGEFIPLVWQGGINFYLGNNAAANGWSATAPDVRKDWWGGYNDMIAIPREALGREPSFNEVSDYWTRRALDFIKSQPGAWLRLMLKKTALFWNSQEFPNNQDYNFMKVYSWVLKNPLVNFGTVAPLALLGLIVLWRKARDLYFLYALVLTSFLGTIAFFVCDRYRLPALPPMFVFAGAAVSWLIEAARRRMIQKLALWLGVLALAGLAVNINLTGERLPGFAQSYCALGKLYASLGNDREAAANFDRAISLNPSWGEAYEQLGLLKMEAGDLKEAKPLLIRATEVWPDFAPPYRALAMIHVSEDSLAQAKREVETALTLAPFLEDTYNVLGTIQRKEGKPEEAIAAFTKELELNPRNWRAHANLGSTYAEMGRTEEAIRAYERAMEITPEDGETATALATLYAKAGRYDDARVLLDRVGSKAAGNVNLQYNRAVILQQSGNLDEAGRLYEEILRENPLHEGTLVNLGVVYARRGMTEEAVSLWQRALAVNPSNETARRNIELARRP